MPTLIRLFVVVGTLAGIAFGSLYVLAVHFEPDQHEVSKPIYGVKIRQ